MPLLGKNGHSFHLNSKKGAAPFQRNHALSGNLYLFLENNAIFCRQQWMPFQENTALWRKQSLFSKTIPILENNTFSRKHFFFESHIFSRRKCLFWKKMRFLNSSAVPFQENNALSWQQGPCEKRFLQEEKQHCSIKNRIFPAIRSR